MSGISAFGLGADKGLSMLMEIQHDRGVTVALADLDRLTGVEAGLFTDAFGELVAAGDCVVVDMHRIRLVDSAGLGSFLTVHRAAIAAGGSIRLASLRPQVATLFRIVRMDQMIAVFDTVDEAVVDWSADHPVPVGVGLQNGPGGSRQG